MLKKLIPFIVLIALILLGIRFFKSSDDAWIRNNDGTWVRQGNPALPIPEHVIQDCYEQNNNRAFDIAYILCREDLCASDRACAKELEQAFQSLQNPSSQTPTVPEPIPSQNTNSNTNIQTPTTTTESTTIPTSTAPALTNTPTQTKTPELAESQKPVEQSQPTTPQEPPKINPNITIETPTSGSAVTSPIVITGKVKAAAGEPIDIQITTKSGTVLIGETANLKTSGPDGWGPYKITIAYQFSSTREGYIVISHGSDTASVPVTFN